ncbi:hypothetical protein [Aliikangiella maris]|uniref:EF-hand domain-containing protein n=2 Tax=Aliikangiella maris TaxID=3162458 RepID=A0ABV2BU33_9GAMM
MNNLSKMLIMSTTCLALTACLEVEDNSNNDVVAALEEQNTLLEEQNKELQKKDLPVSIYGMVVDAETGEAVDAKVKLKIGPNWQDFISVSGEFTIDDLPVNTNIIVQIESPTNAFLPRAFFTKTTNADAGQVVMQALGDLNVSKGVQASFSVLNAEDSSSVEGLEFTYNPSVAYGNYISNSMLRNYDVKSTYNAETQTYSITIPEFLSVSLFASKDIDGDGKVDFVTLDGDFDYSDKIKINSLEAQKLTTLYVEEAESYQPVQLRISIADNLGNDFTELDFYAKDRYTGRMDISYDANTKEYVFDYQSSGEVELFMPAFVVNDKNYSSGEINLRWSTLEFLSITSSGFDDNFNYYNRVEVIDGVAKIVVKPREINSNPNISTLSSTVDEADNYSLKRFYEAPIATLEDSFTLEKYDIFTVIRGNDSNSDAVPNGVTRVGYTTQQLPVDYSLRYNDTFLSVKSSQVLDWGYYRYKINNLVNRATGEEFGSNYYQTVDFQIEKPENTGIFRINDIKLDNNNGTTNGNAIVATTTAGIANTATNNRRSAYVYFPDTIETLEFLRLTAISKVTNGIYSSLNNDYGNIVLDGNIKVSSTRLVSLAENEIVESFSGGGYSVSRGTTLEDGKAYYSHFGYSYMSDNTASQTNNMTFLYAYQVKGETTVHEGTITLYVL